MGGVRGGGGVYRLHLTGCFVGILRGLDENQISYLQEIKSNICPLCFSG